MKGSVLIVEDELDVAHALRRVLQSAGFEARAVESGERAVEVLGDWLPDLVLADLNLPGLNGLELLGHVRERFPEVPVVVMSGEGTIATAVEAMRLGAVDFIEKPIHAPRLTATLSRALEHAALRERHERLLEDLAGQHRLIGSSATMQRLRQLIGRVARTEARVLILGENGTGKELVASAIHAGSERAQAPFIKLNCAALPEHLLESELFGHERGAFTGAVQRRRGRFELAHRGTLFLDEIGDMPLAMQAKILRVLQEGEFERVGGSESVRVDVRVLAATHRELERRITEGLFREDLFYRLNVVTVRTPPLRDRLEDLTELIASFATRSARSGALRFTPDAIDALARYRFPGNVRELQNLVERLNILTDGRTVERTHVLEAIPSLAQGSVPAPRAEAEPAPAAQSPLPPPAAEDPRPTPRGEEAAPWAGADLLGARTLADFERARVLAALHAAGGKRALAAKQLGVSRSTLWRRLRELGLSEG